MAKQASLHPAAPTPQVVCAKCSDYRAELKYDSNRPNRVCLTCYTFLTGNVLPDCKEDKKRGILEVRAGSIPQFPAQKTLSRVLRNKPPRLPSSQLSTPRQPLCSSPNTPDLATAGSYGLQAVIPSLPLLCVPIQ